MARSRGRGQWREAEEEGAGEQAGQGEFLLVGVGGVLLRVMGTAQAGAAVETPGGEVHVFDELSQRW